MTIYNVHIYREMRLVFGGIEAESHEAAAAIARDKPTAHADDIDDCEGENIAALVDVAGDDEYEESRIIDFDGERIRKATPALLEALEYTASQLSEFKPDALRKLGLDVAMATIRAAIAAATSADSLTASDPMTGRFVIRSAEDEGYWSNAAGWVGPEAADVFSDAERRVLHLPVGGRWLALKPYSVLLLYPDYANDGGSETYYAFVDAVDPIEASAVAQRRASTAQVGAEIEPEDFAPLLVTQGHHHGEPVFNK